MGMITKEKGPYCFSFQKAFVFPLPLKGMFTKTPDIPIFPSLASFKKAFEKDMSPFKKALYTAVQGFKQNIEVVYCLSRFSKKEACGLFTTLQCFLF